MPLWDGTRPDYDWAAAALVSEAGVSFFTFPRLISQSSRQFTCANVVHSRKSHPISYCNVHCTYV